MNVTGRLISFLVNRFFKLHDETSSTFTGATQRAGTYIIPFVLPGVFAVGGLRPQPPAEQSAREAGTSSQARRPSGGRRRGATAGSRRRRAPPSSAADHGSEIDSAGEEEEQLQPGATFNWDAYRAAFGDTLYEDAVTEMFAEYAVLYGRIAGWVTSASPMPMTLDEGKSLSEQATDFVTNFLTPILGPSHSPKVHKLIRHVLDAITMHGNLRNGNTDKNEAYHKDDKPFYQRTNKSMSMFTQQLVRQAQGSRAVLRRIEKLNRIHARKGYRSRGRRDALARTGAVHQQVRPTRHLEKVPVAVLARRPGLSRLGELLQLNDGQKVPVLTYFKFIAKLECDTAVRQTLWSTPSYRGGPWYDAVLYSVTSGRTDDATGTEATDVFCAGEVRALLRCADDDVAVVCEMTPVQPEAGCPFAARGCTRLKWATSRRGGWALRAVPLRSVRRVVHVVPDFKDLCARQGPRALPPGYGGHLRDHQAMRFFVNDFTPALSTVCG